MSYLWIYLHELQKKITIHLKKKTAKQQTARIICKDMFGRFFWQIWFEFSCSVRFSEYEKSDSKTSLKTTPLKKKTATPTLPGAYTTLIRDKLPRPNAPRKRITGLFYKKILDGLSHASILKITTTNDHSAYVCAENEKSVGRSARRGGSPHPPKTRHYLPWLTLPPRSIDKRARG